MAAPTHSRKDYCKQRYLDCVKQFGLPLLLIDNTGWEGTLCERISRSWQRIIEQSSEYEYIFSLEVDIIVPATALPLLMAVEGEMIRHPYPRRGGGTTWDMGIALIKRSALEGFVPKARPSISHQMPEFILSHGGEVVDVEEMFEVVHLTS